MKIKGFRVLEGRREKRLKKNRRKCMGDALCSWPLKNFIYLFYTWVIKKQNQNT
jgi:hypothetical protein